MLLHLCFYQDFLSVFVKTVDRFGAAAVVGAVAVAMAAVMGGDIVGRAIVVVGAAVFCASVFVVEEATVVKATTLMESVVVAGSFVPKLVDVVRVPVVGLLLLLELMKLLGQLLLWENILFA